MLFSEDSSHGKAASLTNGTSGTQFRKCERQYVIKRAVYSGTVLGEIAPYYKEEEKLVRYAKIFCCI